MIVSGKKEESSENSKYNVSKRVSENLSFNLQNCIEKIRASIDSVDSSNVEDVDFCNNIVRKVNDIIEVMSETQGKEISKLQEIRLVDGDGNPATEYKLWVVGAYDGPGKYEKRKLVNARTAKEAEYRYRKVEDTLGPRLTCFGVFSEAEEYSQGVDQNEIINQL